MKLIIDQQVRNRFYPNLATHVATPGEESWKKFSVTWPYSEPPMLLDYLRTEHVDHEIQTVDRSDGDSFYIVSVSFFDFSVRWFELLCSAALDRLKHKHMKLLFWYSEGDDPQKIQQHLYQQAQEAGICSDRIWLVSANTRANDLSQCVYFADDELLYRLRNQDISATEMHDRPRSHKCTALVRTHKWWRATAMADIWRSDLARDVFFSYDNSVSVGDRREDNPIEIDRFPGLRSSVDKFLARCPFTADDLTSDQHNDHRLHVDQHYSDSYFNLVLETHMDADQSGGAFLTEKIFKPLKHAQPFVVLGCARTLRTLTDLGYRLPRGIDNSYDDISDTTERYQAAMAETKRLLAMDLESLHQLYLENWDIVAHNQQLFLGSKRDRLNILIQGLRCHQ
jgi:hypothetical protein